MSLRLMHTTSTEPEEKHIAYSLGRLLIDLESHFPNGKDEPRIIGVLPRIKLHKIIQFSVKRTESMDEEINQEVLYRNEFGAFQRATEHVRSTIALVRKKLESIRHELKTYASTAVFVFIPSVPEKFRDATAPKKLTNADAVELIAWTQQVKNALRSGIKLDLERHAEEQRLIEEQKLAEEQRLVEKQRLAEERRLAEENARKRTEELKMTITTHITQSITNYPDFWRAQVKFGSDPIPKSIDALLQESSTLEDLVSTAKTEARNPSFFRKENTQFFLNAIAQIDMNNITKKTLIDLDKRISATFRK